MIIVSGRKKKELAAPGKKTRRILSQVVTSEPEPAEVQNTGCMTVTGFLARSGKAASDVQS